jgi:CubicO group peptidase (beta-lactamase class C family)
MIPPPGAPRATTVAAQALGGRAVPLRGSVAPGFEPVREAFARNFSERGEVGAACAVYRRGEPVVDLWGGLRDRASDAPWEEDTLVLVFSTTKGLSAMAMAVAHARALFDLDERVATYWPEFAAAGKERVTIRQLVTHEAGLCAVDEPLTPAVLADLDALAALLARQAPAWEPGTRHGYHAITLGFYEGELLRRVDPAHRSLGRFFRDEVARPLGLDFAIGLPPDAPPERLATVEMFQPWWLLSDLDRDSWRFLLTLLRRSSLAARAFGNPRVRSPVDFAAPEYRGVELPAVNGYGVVRDIARARGADAGGAADPGTPAERGPPRRRAPGGHVLRLRLPEAVARLRVRLERCRLWHDGCGRVVRVRRPRRGARLRLRDEPDGLPRVERPAGRGAAGRGVPVPVMRRAPRPEE